MFPDFLSKVMPHAWWMALHGKPVANSAHSETITPVQHTNASPLSPTEQSLKRTLNPAQQLYFFGSFNPVHIGHLHMAREALSHFHSQGFRELTFIPTPNPPNKTVSPNYTMLPYEQRLHLLDLAINDWGASTTFKALPLEQYAHDDSDPSYTATTLQRFFQTHLDGHPQQRLHLVMGEESFFSLPSWQAFHWLRRHVHFVVLPRPSHAQHAPDASFKARLLQSELKDMEPLMDYTYLSTVLPIEVNATALRGAPYQHRHWVTPTVFSELYEQVQDRQRLGVIP